MITVCEYYRSESVYRNLYILSNLNQRFHHYCSAHLYAVQEKSSLYMRRFTNSSDEDTQADFDNCFCSQNHQLY